MVKVASSSNPLPLMAEPMSRAQGAAAPFAGSSLEPVHRTFAHVANVKQAEAHA